MHGGVWTAGLSPRVIGCNDHDHVWQMKPVPRVRARPGRLQQSAGKWLGATGEIAFKQQKKRALDRKFCDGALSRFTVNGQVKKIINGLVLKTEARCNAINVAAKNYQSA